MANLQESDDQVQNKKTGTICCTGHKSDQRTGYFTAVSKTRASYFLIYSLLPLAVNVYLPPLEPS